MTFVTMASALLSPGSYEIVVVPGSYEIVVVPGSSEVCMVPGSYEIFMVRLLRCCKGRLLWPLGVVSSVSEFIILNLYNWKTRKY